MAAVTRDYLEANYPRWTISFEYGYWQAVHDNYDASWEGEEDGYISNGYYVSARDLEGLEEEIVAFVEEHPNAA